ncbi:SoxR reducing system RseC family protein [Marinimicrobium sp. ABcell2]|uniref:SoxR reducing system RseC family protein n=1 Tax=Marinimicrobium sp. ABcell2 TaxID=3069751 RepID=UPI0027B2E783|nr:SoxR reducing system RseC family protein [Marinimicrobium sp. ABcell2]MDQ2075280.1 SoxR reducing system RseC family protein [Marinimicrobium sp. ABcell2]
MIAETGRIVAIEAEGLWVETIQRSTCGSCAAEKGCGQSLMAKLSGHTSYLWVLLEGRNPDDYQLGEEIQLGVPEEVVVKGSLFVYLLPLLSMILLSGLAHSVFAHEGLSALGGLLGLLAGGLLVRWRAHQTRYDPRLQPVLLDERAPVHLVTP